MTKRKTQGEKQGRQTNKDGYKTKKKVPRKRRPKTVLADGTGKSQPLIAQAIKQDWLGSDKSRWDTDIRIDEIQKRQKSAGLTAKERMLLACLTDAAADEPKYRQAAVTNFIKMEAQNQSDDHFEVQQATPELHVHGHRHEHSAGNGTDAASIVEAIDHILLERGIDPAAS
jgi:hypothetical protein